MLPVLSMGKVVIGSGFTYDWLKKWHKTFWTNKQAFYQQITPGLKPFPYLPFS